MRQLINFLFFFLCIFALPKAFSQTLKYIHPSLLEIHFSSSRYKTQNQKHFNNGIALAFTKGFRPRLDWRVMINGSYPDSFLKSNNHNQKTLLIESDASLRARLFDKETRFQPFLQAGIGIFKQNKSYGSYMPAGIGIEIKATRQIYFMANAQYRAMLTNHASSHAFFSLGLAGIIGTTKSRVMLGDKPSAPLAIATPFAARDRDNDGIVDTADLCPDEAGLASFHGCPDSDNDGIPDKEDSCPKLFGYLKYHGCPIPDTDKDGVNDVEDQCPYTPGPKENHGCPVVSASIKNIVDSVARKIYFETGKATLLPSSFNSLNTVLRILKTDTALKLVIQGHTDNVGSPASNQILSAARARTVMQFLVANGISETRLSAYGFGAEHAIADNSNIAGRALNRRVELMLSY